MVDHLKISNIPSLVQYVSSGFEYKFFFNFVIFDNSDIEVYVDSVKQETGFTVTGAGDSNGGSVSFDLPPPSGAVVVLRRALVIERTTDFQDSGEFRAKVLNDELDYQTAALQDVAALAGRTLHVSPLGTSSVDLSLAGGIADLAGKVPQFVNDNGTLKVVAVTPSNNGGGSVITADITDATVAGRAMLTAANTAEQRNLLNIEDGASAAGAIGDAHAGLGGNPHGTSVGDILGLQTALDTKATLAQGLLADTAVQPGDAVLLPQGGAAGQVLKKVDNTDYNTVWDDVAGGSGGDLSLGAVTSQTVPIANTTGSGVTLPAATQSLAGVMTAKDKTKLSRWYDVVADGGVDNSGASDAGTAMGNAIEAAFAAGHRQILIPSGTYRLDNAVEVDDVANDFYVFASPKAIFVLQPNAKWGAIFRIADGATDLRWHWTGGEFDARLQSFLGTGSGQSCLHFVGNTRVERAIMENAHTYCKDPGVTFRDGNQSDTGFFIGACRQVILRDCSARGFPDTGVYFSGSSQLFGEQLKVENCLFEGNASGVTLKRGLNGITITGSRFLNGSAGITATVASIGGDVLGLPGSRASVFGNHFKGLRTGLDLRGTSDVIVEANTFDDMGEVYDGVPYGGNINYCVWSRGSQRVQFANNIITGLKEDFAAAVNEVVRNEDWTVGLLTNFTTISFNAAAAEIRDTRNWLRQIRVGDVLTVTGAALDGNNTGFTVTAVTTDGGAVTVTPAPTDEAAGSTISISLTRYPGWVRVEDNTITGPHWKRLFREKDSLPILLPNFVRYQPDLTNVSAAIYMGPAGNRTTLVDERTLQKALPSGGTMGQVLAKASDTDGDVAWAAAVGGGDMLAAIYDPNAVSSDCFDADNIQVDLLPKNYGASAGNVESHLSAIDSLFDSLERQRANASVSAAKSLNKTDLNKILNGTKNGNQTWTLNAGVFDTHDLLIGKKSGFGFIKFNGGVNIKSFNGQDTVPQGRMFWLHFTDDGDNADLVVSGLNTLGEDKTPKLGGDLDVDGQAIVSSANGDITIAPNGSGATLVTNLAVAKGPQRIAFDADAVSVDRSITLADQDVDLAPGQGSYARAKWTVVATSPFAAQVGDRLVCKSGAFQIDLPTAMNEGGQITVVNRSGGPVQLMAEGLQAIEGSAVAITDGSVVELIDSVIGPSSWIRLDGSA